MASSLLLNSLSGLYLSQLIVQRVGIAGEGGEEEIRCGRTDRGLKDRLIK